MINTFSVQKGKHNNQMRACNISTLFKKVKFAKNSKDFIDNHSFRVQLKINQLKLYCINYIIVST